MIKIRLTFLVAEKITPDSQEGRVGCFGRRAEPLKAKLFVEGLRLVGQLQNAGRALSVTWAGNGTERAINKIR